MGGNRVLVVPITAQAHLSVSDVAASVALSGTTRRLPVGRVGLIALDEVLDPAGQKRAIWGTTERCFTSDTPNSCGRD